MALLNLSGNGPQLPLCVFINNIWVIDSNHWFVGRNLNDVQLVGGLELLPFCHSGTSHAGQLVIETEVVLESDRGKSLRLISNLHPFLGLNRLVEPLVIAAAIHDTPGELINDKDLTILDHIVDISPHHAPCLKRLVDMVGQGGILDIGQVHHIKGPLSFFNTPCSQGGRLSLLIDDIVGINVSNLFFFVVHACDPLIFQPGNEQVSRHIELARGLTLPGNNKWGPGLINKDGIDFVHDGECVAPLDLLSETKRHIVSEVVKPKFIVGAIGDVGGIGGMFLSPLYPLNNQTNG